MAAKKILILLDSDRHAYPLIDYLVSDARVFGWKLKLGALFGTHVSDKLKTSPLSDKLEYVDIRSQKECEQAVRKADVVIAMAQDAVMLDIAAYCVNHRKVLVSPARLTRQMALKKAEAKERGALIIMDCGFSPGLDHIIAKKAIDNIHTKGGTISSFRTYSGVMMAEASEQNPWGLSLVEPANELLAWGKHTNRQLVDGHIRHVPGYRLFERNEPVNIQGHADIVAVPEGDSLYYRKIYALDDAHTVVKGKLLNKRFQQIWTVLGKLGITDTTSRLDLSTARSYREIVESLLPGDLPGTFEERLRLYTGADESDIEKMKWLGLLDDGNPVNASGEVSPAQILQLLLQEKLCVNEDARDCIVMQHQLGYELRDERFEMTASLLFEGENKERSALAKVIGFTCGAAAKAVLLGSIKIKGLHIPVVREIYDPILNELEDQGISFHMTEKKEVLYCGV